MEILPHLLYVPLCTAVSPWIFSLVFLFLKKERKTTNWSSIGLHSLLMLIIPLSLCLDANAQTDIDLMPRGTCKYFKLCWGVFFISLLYSKWIEKGLCENSSGPPFTSVILYLQDCIYKHICIYQDEKLVWIGGNLHLEKHMAYPWKPRALPSLALPGFISPALSCCDIPPCRLLSLRFWWQGTICPQGEVLGWGCVLAYIW